MHWRSGRRSRNIEDRRGGHISHKATGGGIGDDRLQKQTGGYVTPDSFTHGSSQQRVRWFKTGLQSDEIVRCNTFSAETLYRKNHMITAGYLYS